MALANGLAEAQGKNRKGQNFLYYQCFLIIASLSHSGRHAFYTPGFNEALHITFTQRVAGPIGVYRYVHGHLLGIYISVSDHLWSCQGMISRSIGITELTVLPPDGIIEQPVLR